MKATVTINPQPKHKLPKTQYGHFIEHLGQCIKGGIWAEGEKPDMFLGGIRPELVDAIKSINPALIRYPGGCFADGYHWIDGIGPRHQRPTRKNKAWARMGKRVGPMENNHFGTDEFLQLCEEVGAEPQITVNVGSGCAPEAAEWVEYCNAPADTGWGRHRARNGHPRPYNVKYWYIGNEIFGRHEIGWQKPEEYVQTFKKYAHAMKKVDPDIKLIACGNIFPEKLGKMGREINRKVLEGIGEEMDYLSIHHYAPGQIVPKNILNFQILGRKGSKDKNIFYDVLGSLRLMESFVNQNLEDIREHSPASKKIPLCFDEWNLWFYFYRDIIRSNYNLRDGLWVATMLNMFHRIAPEMPLTNIAQLVNCIGIINSTRRGTFLTPSALAYKLYTEHAGEDFMESSVDCPNIPHKSELPFLDVSATRSGDIISLFLVNRNYNEDISAEFSLEGFKVKQTAKRFEIGHPNPVQCNSFDKPNEISIEESKENLSVSKNKSGSSFQVNLAPHSLACIKCGVKEI